MAVLPIRTFADPVLRERCREVEDIGSDIEQLVRDLSDSLPQPGGAGLSANQIGVVKRVFVFEHDGEIKECINPRILSSSEETEEDLEGCLSLPGAAMPVPRHLSLELEYSDLSGEVHRVQAEGWIARVFQHEIDHLDGKLILERTDRESRVEALRILEGEIPPHGTRQGPARL
ncbi:MAG: peptide deformylase [Actinomycetota bacterium]|nr:peptide deformylase [Actinomycetota bacterium]MDD5665769.1 peptide deformylase [Actinomycetota bacterium]